MLCILLLPLLPALIALPIFILTIIIFGEKIFPFLFLTLLLIVTSDINEGLRLIVNLSGIIFLLVIFFRQYGFELKLYPTLPAPMLLFIFLVLFSMSVSTLNSGYFKIGVIETLRQTVFFLLIYLFYSFIKSNEDISRYMKYLIAAGIFISVTIVYVFITSDVSLVLLQTQGILHEGGYFKNVAAAGGIFAATIPLTLAFVFNSESKEKKFILWLLFALQLSGLLLTNSRAAVLSVIVSLVYIFFKLKKIRIKAVITSLIILIIPFIIYYSEVTKWIGTYFRVSRIFENTRFYLWDISFSAIGESPSFGIGPGTFKYYMYKYLPVKLGGWDETQLAFIYEYSGLGHQHNFLLFRASELGVLGIISAFFIAFLFFKYSYRVYSSIKDNNKVKNLIIAILGIGYGLFVRSFFEATGILSHGWVTRDISFWILFACIIYLYQKSGEIKTGTSVKK
jgi:O-antigen ligase